MKHIELLAPAGSFEALRAALQNGADAVYLGGKEFSARAYASNFDRETLKEAVEYSHIRGMKVYVTVNTLIKDHEIPDLMEYIQYLYCIDVDAVIVQDLGVFRLIKQAFPDFEIHCSTQMTLHNQRGVELLKELGANRVVLARELTIEEIRKIKENTGMELEVFVHGALCVSYSGQCLMSSFIGGRSGNRGKCAQPCRRDYQLLSPTGKNKDQQYLYQISMRDLNTLERVGELIEGGVTSFKIEGRMKKPQYVASIVGAYRRAIDYYLATGKPLIDQGLQHEMAQMFNRRFTKGYLFNSPKGEMVNIEKPNNRGIYLGKVKEYNRQSKKFQIQLMADVTQGDGIEIWQRGGSDEGGTVTAIALNQQLVKKGFKGQLVELEIRGNVSVGAEVYKTLDIELMDQLEKTYGNHAENKRIPIEGEINIGLGQPLYLTLWDQEGNTVYQESTTIPEKALKVPIGKERVIENIGKLGNTPYELKFLKVVLDEGVAVPISALNSLRREAVEALSDIRKIHHPLRGESKFQATEEISYPTLDKDIPAQSPKIAVKVDTLSQLKGVLEQGVDKIYYGDINTLQEANDYCQQNQVPLYFRGPGILRDEDLNRLDAILPRVEVSGYVIGDLGMLQRVKGLSALPLIADYPLNAMNSYSIQQLEQLGIRGMTLSPELDFKNIKQLRLMPELEVEAVVYGKLPVMTMEYCPHQQLKECNHQCEACQIAPYRYHWGLKDQKQMTFPYGRDSWGRTVILNSQVLFMLDRLEEIKRLRITTLRIEFTDESLEEIKDTLRYLNQQVQVVYLGKAPKEIGELNHLQQGYTRGHYYRGVE